MASSTRGRSIPIEQARASGQRRPSRDPSGNPALQLTAHTTGSSSTTARASVIRRKMGKRRIEVLTTAGADHEHLEARASRLQLPALLHQVRHLAAPNR